MWFGESGGREAFTQAALLLGATGRIVVATGVAQIAKRSPAAAVAAWLTLAEAYPDRFLLGLGGTLARDQQAVPGMLADPRAAPRIGTLREYLDAMDAAAPTVPAPATPARRVLAALGPAMLTLAAGRAWGAHPYLVPPEHTARAREVLGPDAFLGVEQTVVLDRDTVAARETVGAYLVTAHHRNNLRRLAFTDADFGAGGEGPSERLVDALVARGAETIRKRVREHLDAGANHVCVQVIGTEPGRLPLAEWRELADVLL